MTEPGPDGDDDFRRDLVRVLPHLRAFARGLCGRADFADDLVQETAIRAWRARARFTRGTNLRAWAFTILRNCYLSELRRSRRQALLDEQAGEPPLALDPPQEGVVHLSDLQAALQQLRPERREAVLLIGAGGFSYEEAAAICHCAVGTVKSRVARARADLTRMMEGDPGVRPGLGDPTGSSRDGTG